MGFCNQNSHHSYKNFYIYIYNFRLLRAVIFVYICLSESNTEFPRGICKSHAKTSRAISKSDVIKIESRRLSEKKIAILKIRLRKINSYSLKILPKAVGGAREYNSLDERRILGLKSENTHGIRSYIFYLSNIYRFHALATIAEVARAHKAFNYSA